MRITFTVDPYLPVPPRLYGGIERNVDLLIRGLASRGHELTLFAHPDSRTPATLHPYGVSPHVSRAARLRELVQVGSGLLTTLPRTDIVHSWGRLAALLPVLPIRTVPKIQSYERAIPWRGVRRASALAGSSIVFTSPSQSLCADASDLAPSGHWETIFNAVDTSYYTPTARVAPDAPLVFLGRLERIKGPQDAIEIARRAGRRLVIAGNIVSEGPDASFYDREIAPHVDGRLVEYVGPVDDGQKNALLGRAAALLMPIAWDEPFGIVMTEALACGTPVIGFGRGSVPEIVRDGENGFVVSTNDGAVAAVSRLATLDRTSIRRDCEQRFAADVIVSQYEDLYRDMVGRVRARR
jgi:glycosyltransferase involved in cell wall biosynthesis